VGRKVQFTVPETLGEIYSPLALKFVGRKVQFPQLWGARVA
jgi:hypothetical protein